MNEQKKVTDEEIFAANGLDERTLTEMHDAMVRSAAGETPSPTAEKHYRDMSHEEKLASFDSFLAEEKRRHGENTSNLRASLVIGVRHSVHPFAYDLGREFMRLAAAACGDTLEPDGTWAPCRYELWLREALSHQSGAPTGTPNLRHGSPA